MNSFQELNGEQKRKRKVSENVYSNRYSIIQLLSQFLQILQFKCILYICIQTFFLLTQTVCAFGNHIQESNPVDNIEDKEDAWEENEEHEIHPRCSDFFTVCRPFVLLWWPDIVH